MHLYEIKKNKKESIKDFVLTRFKENREGRVELYRSWMLNLAWTRGYQNVDFDKTRRQYIRPTKESWRPRLIANIMLPIMRKTLAKLTYIHPVWDVIPATPDEQDIAISQTSTRLLRHYWDTMDISLKLVRLLSWQSICGNAFFKVGWDSTLGKDIDYDSQLIESGVMQQLMEVMGLREIPKKVKVKEGDVFTEVVSPFNITTDDNAAVLQDTDYIIESSIRSKDWIVEKFGRKWDKLVEKEESEITLFPSVYNHGEKRGPRKGVLIHELYVKHTGLFPKGIHAIFGNTEQLYCGDLPFQHGQLPYVHFTEIYDPGNFWGTCVTEQIRPSQAEYNRIKSGIVEQINLMSKIPWLVPSQAGGNSANISNRPGEIITYNFPYKPEQGDLKPIPAYVERMLDRVLADIQNTASSHDSSEGKGEPGLRSGKAVLALQEADDSIFGPVLLWFDDRLSYTGRLILQTICQFSTEERVLQITGEFNELETLKFTGTMLKGTNDGDYFKVRVKTYGRQIMSRSGRNQLAQTLVESGLLHPINDREQLLGILGAADIMSVYDKNASDRARQWREIQTIISTQQPVPVAPAENHDVHILTVKKYISSNRWDQHPPEIKQLVIQHWQDHVKQQSYEAVMPQLFAQQLIGAVNGPGNSNATGGPTPGPGNATAGSAPTGG